MDDARWPKLIIEWPPNTKGKKMHARKEALDTGIPEAATAVKKTYIL